jgi:hypothetical protein
VPAIISIQIDPECLDFLNQVQYKKNISERQNTFIDSINDLHTTINQLKSQTSFKFTPEDEQAIRRGNFYALIPSLEEKYTHSKVITLPDLQSVLNEEFHIEDKTTINFIIKSLLEPYSLPFALSTLAYAMLSHEYYWSNECTVCDPEYRYSLKAKSAPTSSGEYISFNMGLDLKNFDSDPQKSPLGSTDIQFMVNQERQIKLLPLDMEFNFVDKKALKHFKNQLCKDFQDWIYVEKSHWHTADLWVIPILLGSLLGLIAMMSLLALSLSSISPLLLPPLGLALGLGLASVMHTTHRSIKKEQETLKRPIRLFNGKMSQTTAFFNPPDKITSTRYALRARNDDPYASTRITPGT